MRINRRPFLTFATLAVPWPAGAARSRVGEVNAVSGTAVALFPDDPPRPLSLASPVLIEDLLSTDAAGRLAARLDGGLELRLGGNAKLRIDAALLRGPNASIVLRDFAAGGPLLLDRPPMPNAPPILVVLPWARIGVRGTRIFVGIMNGLGAVFVARGRATVEAIGTSVTLTAGEGVDIPLQPFGPPDLPVRVWGQAKITQALSLVE